MSMEKEFIMSHFSTFSYPFLFTSQGFEKALSHIHQVPEPKNYPSYNIENLPQKEGENQTLRVTLAVPGFSKEDLDISIEQNRLIVSGKHKEEESKNYLHKGVALCQFKRSFLLADGMQVSRANLENGRFKINVVRPIVQKNSHKIAIKSF